MGRRTNDCICSYTNFSKACDLRLNSNWLVSNCPWGAGSGSLEAEVSKLIFFSHPTTYPLDPIPSHLLQAISPAVVPALTHIVNTSLPTGIFPSAFKQARITPLLKKPSLNPTLLGNYRPVSLLTFIAKILERVVFNQVTAFLTQNNLLDSHQSGFRSEHSTETALLSVVEDLRPKNGFQVFITYIGGSVCCFWYGQPPDPPVNPIEKGHLRNHTIVVWLLPLIPSWWSDDSCSHLSMSSRHFLLDEGPSPSTQPS